MTLNLMRGSRVDPHISAWEQLHGKYNFDAHPIAPLGMRIVLHEKPHQRGSWSPHGVEGFYLGPALEHYRCYRGWVVKTQRERISDTIAWHPQTIKMPGASEKELLIKALTDLQTTIHATAHNLPPSETLSFAALHQELTNLFPSLPSSTISPIQQILPRLHATTQRIHPTLQANPPNPAPDQPLATPTTMPTEQRVEPSPTTHDVQRVASPQSPNQDLTSCPTLIPFSTQSPPGRTALPPGGDNISYTRSKLRTTSSTHMGSTARPRNPTRSTYPPVPSQYTRGKMASQARGSPSR